MSIWEKYKIERKNNVSTSIDIKKKWKRNEKMYHDVKLGYERPRTLQNSRLNKLGWDPTSVTKLPALKKVNIYFVSIS